MHSYEQFVCDVSEAFGLPQWKNDKIRKLVTVRGRKIQGISDFFRDDDVFIGVSGKEPLKRDLVADLLNEIYPEEDEYVQTLCKHWEAARAARSKSRSIRNNLNQTGGGQQPTPHHRNTGPNAAGGNNAPGALNDPHQQSQNFG